MLTTAKQARDRVGTFVVMGIMAVFFFHVVVNICMIIGLMPITGLPLPLMSYGGLLTSQHHHWTCHRDEY